MERMVWFVNDHQNYTLDVTLLYFLYQRTPCQLPKRKFKTNTTRIEKSSNYPKIVA